MITLAADDRREFVRWLICGVVVLCAHAMIAAALMQWREPMEEGDLGNDVILLELRPEQVQAEPVPEKLVEKPEEKPNPLPEQPSEVTLPQEAPAPQPQQIPQAELPPAPATTAAQTARARMAVSTWRTQIAEILEHNKRYPPEARSRREQGVAQLAFSIDREGHVLSSRILTSSGFSALDQETLALLQRALPFPAPPPEVAGDEIKFTVPVRFSIR